MANEQQVSPETQKSYDAFLDAVKTGNLKAMAEQIDNSPDLIKSARSTGNHFPGRTALHFAASTGNDKIVRYLIKSGADVNAKDKHYGETALHQAGNEAVAKALLDNGADINSTNDYGSTPLHSAISEEDGNTARPEVVRFLIKNKAQVNAKTGELSGSVSPLHLAENEAMAQLLLDSGANVDAKDKNGNTALHGHNSLHGVPEGIARVLLKHGTDVNAKNDDGDTPLHSVGTNVAVAQLLLQNSANINAKNKHGETPLHYAAKVHYQMPHYASQLPVALLLIENGARLDITDERGETAIDAVKRQFNKPADQEKITRAIKKAIETSQRGSRLGEVQVAIGLSNEVRRAIEPGAGKPL